MFALMSSKELQEGGLLTSAYAGKHIVKWVYLGSAFSVEKDLMPGERFIFEEGDHFPTESGIVCFQIKEPGRDAYSKKVRILSSHQNSFNL